MSGGIRSARLLVPGVVALVVIVAVAAAGSTPTGSDGSRRPSQWFLDVFASLVLVLMAIGAILLVLLVVLRPQEILDQVAARERRRGRPAALVVLVALVLLLVLAIRRFAGGDIASAPGLDPGSVADAAAAVTGDRYEPEFATSAVVVVLAVAAVTLAAAFLVAQRRRAGVDETDPVLQEHLAVVLDETLDDLRAEADPRKAVIAAYARLERVLAAHGVPRHAAEAPQEYLSRMLRSLDVPERAATRLTELFARAKFSQHDVRPEMKDEAIDALEAARDELRAGAERARAERARALSAARGRAAT